MYFRLFLVAGLLLLPVLFRKRARAVLICERGVNLSVVVLGRVVLRGTQLALDVEDVLLWAVVVKLEKFCLLVTNFF